MNSGIVERLITELMKLPGIGRKTAQRLSFFIMGMPEKDAFSMAKAITELKEKAGFCRHCFNITEDDICSICRGTSRDRGRICVVEEPSNLIVIENTKAYKGLYHVLLGVLSPIDGITPEMLRIRELVERVKKGGISEVILATNPNTKGETTAQYIAGLLKPLGVKVTRIAYGLPIGGDIEFADEVTLTKALEGRREV
ncbi:MAG TPA: recombination protein RecR [Nitrospirae bacterium]|nr:recombination protein RecR [bacterium BMS3Abin10]GBE38904.1 recombination protein RecR [bacterium BMS3Bbin08]HDH50229.1 recombination protein RecR [Nitrospirota bacterium]HDK81794.1 recombination protein RecR [Nitrospirota bacterium]HDO25397.1 recombination protein RecR [Nitrospirota bacterium]